MALNCLCSQRYDERSETTIIEQVHPECPEHSSKYQLYTTKFADGTEWKHLSKLADKDNNITHYMCCICFEYVLVEDLFRDETGTAIDMCVPCGVYSG